MSPSQIAAVVLAVEDEVYDFGYQKQFDMVGASPKPGVTRLPIYITPELNDGEGKTIYRLMPHGEVLRAFYFNRGGLAVLEGAADGDFPPTDPNLLTVYLDDDDVCKWKHDWLRNYFEILDSPPRERIEKASERQKQRVGFSAQELSGATEPKAVAGSAVGLNAPLSRGLGPFGERPRVGKGIDLPKNERERRLATIVFNETGTLTAGAVKGPGSEADLHAARVAVAEVCERQVESGRASHVAVQEITDGLWDRLLRGDKQIAQSWNDCLGAARTALKGSNTTNGANRFRVK